MDWNLSRIYAMKKGTHLINALVLVKFYALSLALIKNVRPFMANGVA
jgi:hypothetical protein